MSHAEEIASELAERLSRISTHWTILGQAQPGQQVDVALAAQTRLVQRYSVAVYRYLYKLLGDPAAADEMFQEFCVRLVRGDFKNATAEKGRFRHFLKRTLHNLAVDHRRRQQRLPVSIPEQVEPIQQEASEVEFQRNWREELLTRAWTALQELENQTGRPLYAALRLRADFPQARSEELARRLTESRAAAGGKATSADQYRKVLMESRARFADLLVLEVAETIPDPTREDIESELAELELLSSCQEAVHRWGGAPSK